MNDSSHPITIGSRMTNALPHSELLRLLIHDLRTPLNVIGLALRLMADSSENEMKRELEFAESSVQQMVRILKLLAELARVVDPKTLPVAANVNVREWVQAVVASASQGGGVAVDFQESLPESVELHEVLAKSAVRLAYENALAASDENRVSVSCWGESDGWRLAIDSERPTTTAAEDELVATRTCPPKLFGSAETRLGVDLAAASWALERISARLYLCPIEFGSRIRIEFPNATTLLWPF